MTADDTKSGSETGAQHAVAEGSGMSLESAIEAALAAVHKALPRDTTVEVRVDEISVTCRRDRGREDRYQVRVAARATPDSDA